MPFLISVLRAVIELVGLCLLGQGALYLLAGPARDRNPIYRLFSIITAPPRRVARRLVPAALPGSLVAVLTFIALLFIWIGLAWMRNFI